VAGLFGSADLMLNEAATTDAVRQAVRGRPILHLACHGQFSSRLPYASGIRLADRWFTLREIYNLRLDATLVTLSGCSTGKNAVRAGDELVGLLRGFLAAGATSLLASLWAVHDASGTRIMTAFYKRLNGGQACAVALRESMLEAMREEPHPAFWAPYVIQGKP
jgi:CHAT domain-containing protein